MPKEKQFILYKIYYDYDGKEKLVYLGRTKQPLRQRLYNHFFKPSLMRTLSLNITCKVEYTLCKTEADMNLYEIYYINLYKPTLNVDDKCKDDMTVSLPDLEWIEWKDDIINKWKDKYNEKHNFFDEKYRVWNQYVEVGQRAARMLKIAGRITEGEYYDYKEAGELLKQNIHINTKNSAVDKDFVKNLDDLTIKYVNMNEESEDKTK